MFRQRRYPAVRLLREARRLNGLGRQCDVTQGGWATISSQALCAQPLTPSLWCWTSTVIPGPRRRPSRASDGSLDDSMQSILSSCFATPCMTSASNSTHPKSNSNTSIGGTLEPRRLTKILWLGRVPPRSPLPTARSRRPAPWVDVQRAPSRTRARRRRQLPSRQWSAQHVATPRNTDGDRAGNRRSLGTSPSSGDTVGDAQVHGSLTLIHEPHRTPARGVLRATAAVMRP